MRRFLERLQGEVTAQAVTRLGEMSSADMSGAAAIAASECDRYVADIHAQIGPPRAKGLPVIACAKGCSYCCKTVVVTSQLAEAARVAQHLARTKEPDVLLEIRSKLTEYAEGLASQEVGAGRMNLPCPFLIADACSIYAVRPITCRAHNSLSLSDCRAAYERNEEVNIRVVNADREVGIALLQALSEALKSKGASGAQVAFIPAVLECLDAANQC